MRNNFNITNIEAYISSLVHQSGATDTIYNNRPKSAVKVNDFAVVAVSGSVEDMACYGKATVGVDFFAKDINNLKNATRLEVMCRKFIDFLASRDGYDSGDFSGDFNSKDFFATDTGYLIDRHPSILGDSADDYGFTARLINLKITIKTK